jgi:transposase
MANGSGVSRGDRNRNARLDRLRALVPVINAIVGIDLADKKQMVVVCDHDSKVLARKTFRCRAWDLGAALDWAAEQAAARGFAGATVAREPTGHRWRVLGQLAGDRSLPFVCVQPALTSWARRTEDLTSDKTDEKDAVLIARLTAQLRCYVPEPVDETWGRLRHLGARREQVIIDDGQSGPADAGAAGVCLAGEPGHRQAPVPVLDLAGGAERHSGPRRRRSGPDPAAGSGPVRISRSTGSYPTR